MSIKRYFKIAKNEAEHSDCLRRHIGAIIVKDGIVVGRGANRVSEKVISCSKKGWCIRNVMNILLLCQDLVQTKMRYSIS